MPIVTVPAPSNVNTILQRIVSIAQTVSIPTTPVTTITAAFDTQPADPTNAIVPFVVIQSAVKPGVVRAFAGTGQLHVDDHFKLVLCLELQQAEALQQTNLALALQWRDAVLATFAQHLQLSPAASPGNPDLAQFIIDAVVTSWLGPTWVEFGQTTYTCLEFEFTVREHQVVTFAT